MYSDSTKDAAEEMKEKSRECFTTKSTQALWRENT